MPLDRLDKEENRVDDPDEVPEIAPLSDASRPPVAERMAWPHSRFNGFREVVDAHASVFAEIHAFASLRVKTSHAAPSIRQLKPNRASQWLVIDDPASA